jgi:competence protein CoiA
MLITTPGKASETEIHRRCKAELFQALLHTPSVTDVRLERDLKGVRADVSADIGGVPVAIEVQISTLSIEDVVRRTKAYTARGIHVLWLCQWTPALNDRFYSPEPWERWLHAAYFGRVYYWKGGTSVVPYHFAPAHLHVKKRAWHTPGGRMKRGGGYIRLSKRYKTAIRGDTLDLLTDFAARERDWWKSGDTEIPPAKLYCDTRPRFWNVSVKTASFDS